MAALESTGYVEMGKRDVHLTERGLEVARQMWERHCFFVGLLEDAGVTPEVASQEGCHMEHCLSEESFEKLRSMLGRGEATDSTSVS
ncbi:metal-dependent transcriptional regulator [Collinsella sp. AF02-46-1]|uniref:metal-dependent transcriptional regulator n=2 Tax=Collinsella TaxID=102106 RepID=UPI001F32D515|nr:iron dependent repressor, metal binding and dimerization domain protein [Collinsella sp. AF02-46-1]